jgi:hypothetical protein
MDKEELITGKTLKAFQEYIQVFMDKAESMARLKHPQEWNGTTEFNLHCDGIRVILNWYGGFQSSNQEEEFYTWES